MVDKKNTHLVLKNDDVRKYCDELQQAQLSAICETISNGRIADGKTLNTYYICNTDEPYAEVVHGVIMGGEAVKIGN